MILPSHYSLNHFTDDWTILVLIKPFHFRFYHFTFDLTISLLIKPFHCASFVLKPSTDHLSSDMMVQHDIDKWIHDWLNCSTIIVHCVLTSMLKHFWIVLIIYFLTTSFHIRAPITNYCINIVSFLKHLFHFTNHLTVPLVFSLFHFNVLYFWWWWQPIAKAVEWRRYNLAHSFHGKMRNYSWAFPPSNIRLTVINTR